MQNVAQRFFAGRTLVVATMHGKEKILQPQLEESLGVRVVTPAGFDTDRFGTFSGEVERTLSPLHTARKKCEEAARLTGESLVLASEGSFGAHPVMGFVPGNEELLLLKDFRNDWEFRATVLSTETNFSGNYYYEPEDANFFLTQIGFPAHAVILRKSKEDLDPIYKGVQSWETFNMHFSDLIRQWGKVWIETDMRAHLNPTRQKVIGQACEKLLAIVQHACPVCEAPGFAVAEVVAGLPCRQCEAPTRTPKAYRYHCQHCGHAAEQPAAAIRQKEDPMYCDECNP